MARKSLQPSRTSCDIGFLVPEQAARQLQDFTHLQSAFCGTFCLPGKGNLGWEVPRGMPSNLQGLVESSRTSRWSQRLVKAPSWLGEAAACSKASCWLQEGVPNMEPSIPATSHQSRGNSRSLRIFLTVKSSAPCHIAAARLHEAAMLADSVSNCCLLYLGAG